MGHYAVGTRFEHKVRDDLVDNGYDVIRAAGSKGSTKVDLAAFKPGQLLLVQCKLDGVLGPAEWDRLVEVAAWVSALPVLAQNGHHGRGVIYTRLLGPKLRGVQMHRQPCAPFRLDELTGPFLPPLTGDVYADPGPDCPDEFHGADGGRCATCGWDPYAAGPESALSSTESPQNGGTVPQGPLGPFRDERLPRGTEVDTLPDVAQWPAHTTTGGV